MNNLVSKEYIKFYFLLINNINYLFFTFLELASVVVLLLYLLY